MLILGSSSVLVRNNLDNCTAKPLDSKGGRGDKSGVCLLSPVCQVYLSGIELTLCLSQLNCTNLCLLHHSVTI